MLYHLPKNLRHHLARPIGELFVGDLTQTRPKVDQWLENQLSELIPTFEATSETTFKATSEATLETTSATGTQGSLMVSCVGDVITESLLNHPRWQKHLKYCFIDGDMELIPEFFTYIMDESLNLKYPFQNYAHNSQ